MGSVKDVLEFTFYVPPRHSLTEVLMFFKIESENIKSLDLMKEYPKLWLTPKWLQAIGYTCVTAQYKVTFKEPWSWTSVLDCKRREATIH